MAFLVGDKVVLKISFRYREIGMIIEIVGGAYFDYIENEFGVGVEFPVEITEYYVEFPNEDENGWFLESELELVEDIPRKKRTSGFGTFIKKIEATE